MCKVARVNSHQRSIDLLGYIINIVQFPSTKNIPRKLYCLTEDMMHSDNAVNKLCLLKNPYSQTCIESPNTSITTKTTSNKMKMEIHNKSEASCWRNLSTKIDTHFLYVRNFIYTFWLPWQQTCMTGSCPVWPWPGLTLGCQPGTKRNALGSHPLCDFGPDPSRTPT